MAKALKFAVGLVCFPILPFVAVIHGCLFGFWAVARWFWRNAATFVLFPIAAVSAARVLEGKVDHDRQSTPSCFAVLYLLPLLFLTLVNLNTFSWSWDTKGIFPGLLATNVFSILYEIGRVYWNWLRNKKKPETAPSSNNETEESPDLVEDFIELLEDIQAVEEMTRELAEKWYKKIEDALKNGKIGLKEACNLKQVVDNGLHNSISRSAVDNA